jgi:hypothetical protein
MRTFLAVTLLLSGLGLTACRCSPPNPVPITLRVVNGSKDPIYVNAASLGLTVRRDLGGQFFAFDDQACDCGSCAKAYDSSCVCPDAGVGRVLRVSAEGSAERTWNGVVQVTGSSPWTGDGTCFEPENAPVNEPFSLQLCFAAQKPSGVQFDDAGVGLGQVPGTSRTCVTKQFMIEDGVVEIGPARGATCLSSADCKGADELCFDGACTSGCPANDYPELGSNWSLIVASLDNMGFFTRSPRAVGNQYSGTGTITAVVYVGTSLQVAVTRPGLPNEQLTGKFTVQLPPMTGAPLQVGAVVQVLVVDDGKKNPSRAIVVRDPATNTVLFAADMAQDGALLNDADLAPLRTENSQTPNGCRQGGCGRLLFYSRQFTSGAAAVSVEPGQKASLTLASGTYSFLSVSNGAYPTTNCDVASIRPWVLWRER